MKNLRKPFATQLAGLLAVLFLMVFVASCGSDNNKANDNETDSESVNGDETITEQAEKMVYPLPTPFKVTQMLNAAGAGYIYDLCNPVENVDKYFTEKSKALNLGVYGADLSYASTYNKTQKTTLYLSCTKRLSDELGVSNAYDESTVKRIDENIDNTDSLFNIITKSFHNTFDYLNNNEKGSVSVLVLAGGYIEGVYISTQLSQFSMDNRAIIEGIMEQKAPLKQLILVMENYKDDTGVAEILADLNAVSEKYNELEQKEELSATDLEDFAAMITEIREKIVS